MKVSCLNPRRVWPALALLLCLLTGDALVAQRCWSCVLGPWSPQGDCVSLVYDGYYECVQTTQYCAGVLPRCFSGTGMLAADGSVLALGPETTANPTREAPVAINQQEVERRPCDDAIVARHYSPEVAAELRRQSRTLRI